jgi:polar amino acid transport system substrate-binding protein
MKKLFALVLALALCLSLAACGGNNAAQEAPAEETAAGEEAAPAAEEASAELPTIEAGKLIMATNAQFPPYEMVADGEGVNGTGLEGIDVEIAAALAEKLGLELQIDDMEFDSALVAVQNNQADMVLAGLSYREDRDEIMDFSDPYAQGVQVIIVKEGSAIQSADDLANASLIGTQRGTTGYIYCADDYGEDHVSAYDNGAAAVQALINGQVDCVVIDKMPAETFVAENEGLTILDSAYVVEDYCLAVDEGNTQLQTALNDALNELKADGTLQSIVDKYINAN